MDYLSETLVRRFNEFLRKKDLALLATEMSPRWFFMDFYIYPPLIALALAGAFWRHDPWQWLVSGLLIVVGLVVWTLAEYLIHRFGFHHVPGLKAAHMAHHADPEGLHGSPTVLTVLAFAALAFAPLCGLFGPTVASAVTAGLMAGYLAYVTVHWVVHHAENLGPRWMRARLRWLIRAHAVHHHQSEWNFGVTTSLWDRVFGTLHRR
jgi:sterol desaturase/sphingolipid hydroxylase (fatty acid hydroxylase superfamily)